MKHFQPLRFSSGAITCSIPKVFRNATLEHNLLANLQFAADLSARL
jgi:hypothetical protein